MENQTFLWCIFCGFGTMQVVYRKEEEAMKKILAIIGIVILILAGGLAVSYNGLAGSRESVETAQADVDTMLQRRADLIPNLVSTVKSYAKHETEVFDKVLEARSQLMDAYTMEEKAEADQQVESALNGLKVVVENYPELKSDTTYVSLMDELSGSENRISVARKDYNDAVKSYNTKLVKVPGNILGSVFGFEKASYFEASTSAQETPDVGEMLAD